MKTICLWLFLGLLPLPAAADTVGRVVAVNEGDSLVVLVNEREQMQIRLLGIDAPEVRQDFARESRSSLAAHAMGKEVRVDDVRKDHRGQILARVWAADAGCSQPGCPKTLDVGLAQLAAGLAWHDPKFERELPPADRQRYGEAEFMAKIRRLGLWSGKSPKAPWAWRQQRLEE